MNAQDRKVLEQFLFNALTSYRIVPVLYTLVNNKHADSALVGKALKALMAALLDEGYAGANYAGKLSEVLDMLNEYQNWIRYTLADFAFYATQLQIAVGDLQTTYPSVHYLEAMKEQIVGGLLDWDIEAFHTNTADPIILDIGCGCAPYLKHFRAVHAGWIHYKGLDKRAHVYAIEIPNNMQYSFLSADVTEDLCDGIKLAVSDVNVLFWGNSLHCFPEPYNHVQKFLSACPNVRTILILEPSPDSALNFAFDFHMGVHKKGSVTWDRILFPVSTKEWEYEAIPASSQHTMYRFTKKA